MKALKYIAFGVGAFIGGRYILSLSRASNTIVVDISGQRGLISAQGINVSLNYNIKNPTRANLKITPPFIKIGIDGQLVASSKMKEIVIPASIKDTNDRISINAFSQTGEIPTTIMIPWLSLLTISPTIVSKLKNGNENQKVELTIETLTQVYTSVGNFPHEQKTAIQL